MKIIFKSIDNNFVKFIVQSLFIFEFVQGSVSYPYRQLEPCTNRLQSALEHMRHRNFQVKSSRSNEPIHPYRMYHTLYGQTDNLDEDFYQIKNDRKYYAKKQRPNNRLESFNNYPGTAHYRPDQHRQPNKLIIDRVDIEELQVKLPPSAATTHDWVQVDKCKFNSENATLDTRLTFPDLMLSGRVILQPSGGKCNMILRLRRAGIEFHTKPIALEKVITLEGGEESKRINAASVRTDSHFAEPGFLSVFAHGCEGPTGIKIRRNSKHRNSFTDDYKSNTKFPFDDPQDFVSELNSNWRNNNSEYQNIFKNEKIFPKRGHKVLVDEMDFNDDVLHVSDGAIQEVVQPNARAFAQVISNHGGDQVNDALINELETLFSMGVRGLLTTYMQRALQPAIKETLMENMGFTLSYG